MTTDGDIAKIARQIDAHQQKIIELLDAIRESEHPNAEQMYNWLLENLFGHGASAQNCVHTHFEYPERWIACPSAIYYKTEKKQTEITGFYKDLEAEGAV